MPREARSSIDRKGRLAMIRLARPRPICFRDTSSSKLALLMSIAPDEFRASALVTSEGPALAAGADSPPPDPPSPGRSGSGWHVKLLGGSRELGELDGERAGGGYAAGLMPQTSCHASKARVRSAR